MSVWIIPIITMFFLLVVSCVSFYNFVKYRFEILWFGIGLVLFLRFVTTLLIFFHFPFTGYSLFLLFHHFILPLSMAGILFFLLRWFNRTTENSERIKKALETSRRRYYNIFNYSNISLTEEDVGLIRYELNQLFPEKVSKETVITYLRRNPGDVRRLISLIKILDVNEQTVNLFQASSKAEMIDSYHKTFTEESSDVFIVLAAALVTGEKSIVIETELLTLKGEKLYVLMQVSLPRTKDERTAVISIVDITSQKNLQREVTAERDRAQQYFDIVEVIVVIYDTKGIILKINRKGCGLFGYTEEELLGKNWFDLFILPENRELLKKKFKDIMEEKLPYNSFYDEDLLKKNGDTVHVEWRAVPFRGDDGCIQANLCSGIDVTELRMKQQELEKSEQRFKAVEKLAKTGYWEMDVLRGKYSWSDGNYRILGLEPGEVTPSKTLYRSFIHPDDKDSVREAFSRSVREHREYQHRYRLMIRGAVKYVVDWAQHFFDEKGDHVYSAGLSQDITLQVLTEQKLEKSIKEKEALLRELHHRTKNNMQVISAMLNLRAGVENDLHISSVFLEMDSKIQSMARAHEKLYKSGDLSRINFSEYFLDLVELLKESYDTNRRNISFKVDVDDVPVLLDVAVPCGLILNELVTNAIKYAFPGGRKGIIEILLKKQDRKTICFTVKDNGVGMDSGVCVEELDSLGMRTIMALGEGQLQGTVSWETDKGVSCSVHFRDDTYTERV